MSAQEANARLIAAAATMRDIIIGYCYCPECGAGTSFAPEDGRSAMAGDGNPVVYCESACGFETTMVECNEAADRFPYLAKAVAS